MPHEYEGSRSAPLKGTSLTPLRAQASRLIDSPAAGCTHTRPQSMPVPSVSKLHSQRAHHADHPQTPQVCFSQAMLLPAQPPSSQAHHKPEAAAAAAAAVTAAAVAVTAAGQWRHRSDKRPLSSRPPHTARGHSTRPQPEASHQGVHDCHKASWLGTLPSTARPSSGESRCGRLRSSRVASSHARACLLRMPAHASRWRRRIGTCSPCTPPRRPSVRQSPSWRRCTPGPAPHARPPRCRWRSGRRGSPCPSCAWAVP